VQRSRCQRRKKRDVFIVEQSRVQWLFRKKGFYCTWIVGDQRFASLKEMPVTSVANQASFVCVLSSLPWRFQHSRNASICAGAERISRFSWTELL